MELWTHPHRHLVGLRFPVVIVEDEDGGHYAGGHHEHDGVEICGLTQSDFKSIYQWFWFMMLTNEWTVWCDRYDGWNCVEEYGERQQNCYT